MMSERQYKYFDRRGSFPDISFHQRQRNTSIYGYTPEPSYFVIHVTPKGVLINGDYGTNPPAEEMLEMALIMDECAKAAAHYQTLTAPNVPTVAQLEAFRDELKRIDYVPDRWAFEELIERDLLIAREREKV